MKDKYDVVILLMSFSGIIGGGERLYLRMVRWLHLHNYRTIIMYSKSASVVPELLEKFKENGAEQIVMPDMGVKYNMPVFPDFMNVHIDLPSGSRVKIICIQSEYNFFAAQMIQHNLPDCVCDVVQYVIHQNEFCRFEKWRQVSGMVANVFRRYYRRLVERMEENGNVVYYLIEAAENIHALLGMKSVEESPVKVIQIGMDVDVFDEERIRNRYYNDRFLIVATARLDFPEKGFLIGLVDEFEAVLEKKPNARLIIVGDGRSRAEMEAKVAASSVASAIDMVGNLPYEELNGYINKANLYISNGSGPLDAARVGLPSTAATLFTTECLTTGYWCDSPDNLGYNGTIPVREMILKTMDMSEEDYLALAHRTYDVFIRSRGMDSFMEQMLMRRNLSEKPLLSRGYLLRSKWLRVLMNVGIKLFK